MHPVIPAEMISGAAELAIYFVTAIGVFVSLMLTGRV